VLAEKTWMVATSATMTINWLQNPGEAKHYFATLKLTVPRFWTSSWT
jgi:hypothetical protein